MATDNPLFGILPKDDDSRSEWSRLAAKRARERKTQWRAYAAMMTRNPKVKLEFTGGTPRTDGDTIWLRIPIELGNPAEHSRKVCGERDENDLMVCLACRTLEDVTITMYHEVAHIVFDSFAKMSDWDKTQHLLEAVRLEANGVPDGKRIKKILKAIEARPPGNFVEASNLVSKWLGLVLNAAEDGRVNKAMMDSRPGTRIMFRAQTYNIFENGLVRDDGTTAKWNEAPKNMQAIIALYCKIFGLDYSTWFSPEVVEDLKDPVLDRLCYQLGTARSVQATYRLSIPVLERLRELGYCKVPDEPEDDPIGDPGETRGEKSKPEKGEDDSEPSTGEGAGGGGEASDDDDEEESNKDDASGSSGGDKADDQPGEGESSATDEESSGDDPSEDDSEADSPDKGEGSDASDDESGDGTGAEDGADGSDEESEEWDGTNPTRREDDAPYTEEQAAEDGDPDAVKAGFDQFGRHDEDGNISTGGTEEDQEEVSRAISQGEYFDSPSRNIWGVKIHRWADGRTGAWGDGSSRYGTHDRWAEVDVPEAILGPALARLRVVFSDNRKAKYVRNLDRGKRINGAVLGRRVPVGDTRLFEKRILPGKRDYFVLIGLDVSGSTARPGLLPLIKRAAFAKAELCQRLGVKFAVYAHTGTLNVEGTRTGGLNLDIYEVKAPNEPWSLEVQERLKSLVPSSANLDGHTMEFYRKVTERETATDKIILYYTDGAMPLENYDEELSILQREIEIIKRQGVSLVGVGIKTDSPKAHGLDTIVLDKIEDVPQVVAGLESRLNR